MARIGKTFTFEAAHRLLRHNGKCRNVHGHSYRVEVTIEGLVQEPDILLAKPNPETGMVLDFTRLKEWWLRLEPSLDHTTILEDRDELVGILAPYTPITSVAFTPTAENLSAWLREDLMNWLLTIWPQGFPTPHVRVWETATSWAEA